MLTELKAYSAWPSAPTLSLSGNGREETDLIQVRDIQGLDPVKASVNTTPFGSVDGVAYIGSSVPFRNIVLTLHPNPDWHDWTFESLRRLLYSYFMPKLATKLQFYSDDIPPVEILGIVEDCNVNMFATDVELIVSIICPDPYFTEVNPTILTGQSSDGTVPLQVQYDGDVVTGFTVELTRAADPAPTVITVQVGDPSLSTFRVTAGVDNTKYFLMGSIPGSRYAETVSLTSGVITNLLASVQPNSTWPVLSPGENDFSVITDTPGKQDWTLTYYARRGGL